MLGPYNSPPPEDSIICSEGNVDIPFDDYCAWEIRIDESTDLSFLNFERLLSQSSLELIDWADESKRLPGTLIESVFINSLPTLELKRPELFHTNDVGLFLEFESEVRKIEVQPGQLSVQLEIPHLGYGRVWAEPISRRREFAGFDALGELTFIVIPECKIHWPNDLYTEFDKPQIILESSFENISLEFENAIPTDKNHRIWCVKQGETIVEGSLKCDDIVINLTHRIFRASLRKKDNRHDYCVLSTDFEYPIELVATGGPHEDSKIFLINDREKANLGQITFNNAGEHRNFTTFRFRDAILNYEQPLGLFAIESRARLVETNTYFLNFEKLREWIVDSDEEKPFWLSIGSKTLREIIEIIRQIKKASFRELHILDSEAEIPKPVADFYKLICICASIFDDTVLLESADQNENTIRNSISGLSPEVDRFFNWFKQAKDMSRADQLAQDISSEKLLDDYKILSWKPPFNRWHEKIGVILSYLKELKDVTGLVAEWSKDVERGYRPKYSSKIANQKYGLELTNAWIRYQKDNYDGVVTEIKSLIPQMASPVADLAAILLRICWLRKACFRSQFRIDYRKSNKKLASAFEELSAIVDFGGNSKTQKVPNIPYFQSLIQVLPLSTNDRLVLELFSKNIDFEYPNIKMDWLACWYALRLEEQSKSMDKVWQLAKVLGGLLSIIPASPDKKIITETREKYS